VTKLDGTSKGGMVVAIQKELGCRSNSSASASSRTICSPSTPNNSRRRCLRNKSNFFNAKAQKRKANLAPGLLHFD